MTSQEYKQMLETMRRELDSLLEHQEETEQKIAQLKQAIISLAPLAKEPTDPFSVLGGVLGYIGAEGITEGIREILRAAYPHKLSPVEIKEQLKKRGQDLSLQKNVMASVHSALKRLEENREIVRSDDGLTCGWRRRHAFHRRGVPPPPPSLTDVVPSWDVNEKK